MAENDQEDDDLVAYLDGEMDDETAAAFESRLQREPALQAQAEALKRTWELLDYLPQPEPSATFTSKTLDKIAVLRPQTTSALTVPADVSVITYAPPEPQTPQRAKWPTFVGWTAAAVVVFALGYAIKGPGVSKVPKLAPEQVETEMALDLRILHQLPQYEVGDNIAFLQALDQPELFGEEALVR
jgi:anti-sigma factor RsiW